MNARRLIGYLILNVVVSASATLGVLWLWDRTHPAGPGRVTAPLPTSTGQAVAAATLPVAPPADTEPAPGGGEPEPTPTIYEVQAGDTLGTIAQRFDVSVADIMAANGLTDPNNIPVGLKLIIPIGGFAPPTEPPATPGPAPTDAVEPPRATATRDPNVPLPRLTVREVLGAGRLTDEVLVLVNEGGPVDLAGWSVRDETGRLFVFPALMLFQDGSVNVHTTAGSDTVTDLFWGQGEPVWASGKVVLLSDANGNLHSRFTVP
jgi:LysM repeat protein